MGSVFQEDPLEEGMTAHSSILVWRIPWTEEPGGLQSIGSLRVGHDWCDSMCTHTHTHTQWGNWFSQPLPFPTPAVTEPLRFSVSSLPPHPCHTDSAVSCSYQVCSHLRAFALVSSAWNTLPLNLYMTYCLHSSLCSNVTSSGTPSLTLPSKISILFPTLSL